jgi:hypothetical protein
VALRRRNGVVAIPAVDHPLMRLNTWPPPADTFQPKDTLIAPVTRRVERLESGSY